MLKILNLKETIESLLCFYAKEDFIFVTFNPLILRAVKVSMTHESIKLSNHNNP